MAGERPGLWQAKATPTGPGFAPLDFDDPELTAKAREALASVRAERKGPPLAKAPSPGSKAALHAQVDALQARLERAEAELARLRPLAPLDLSAPPLVRVVVKIATRSELNAREPWQVRASRRKRQRAATLIALCTTAPGRMGGPALLAKHGRLSVHIERRGPRAFDVDAIASSMKGVQDEVADWLGCDDSARSPVVWSHSQVAHKRHAKEPDVVVEIRPA